LPEIIVTCGGKAAIYNYLATELRPGDEVIIFSPYWPTYPDLVKHFGAIPVIIETSMSNNFMFSIPEVAKNLSKKTKLIILNSPSNPTGVIYPLALLNQLAMLVSGIPCIKILCDEIYEKFSYKAKKLPNILNCNPHLRDRVIIINGFSKSHAMTGLRLGYAAGPKFIIERMLAIQSQSVTCPPSLSQFAALGALQSDLSYHKKNIAEFKRRRNYMHRFLVQYASIYVNQPDGAFYIFPNFQVVIDKLFKMRLIKAATDIELVKYLLEEFNLAVTPGSFFGAPGYIRISLSSPMNVLKSAKSKFKELFMKIGIK
jgi:aspartate aminotransferase